MVMSMMLAYLAAGMGVLTWWSWRYRQALKNIFQDFTQSSAVGIIGLLAVLLILLWPVILFAWWQSQTPEFQQHYHDIEELRQLGKYQEVIEAIRANRHA